MDTPYKSLPKAAFWRQSVAAPAPAQVEPFAARPFQIGRTDRVATGGSCFAQHIARHLQKSGYNYYVTEPAHPIASADIAAEFNYGTFTARYGNIYTPRQLTQLFARAYGDFIPQDDHWTDADGAFIDPFRPQIQPGGYDTLAELHLDRAKHLRAVREAFENLDVFVFTLGLTEAWISRTDEAVLPLCPGVAGGTYDPARYRFHNFTLAETCADTLAFIDQLRGVNPRARVILTVSPVPLIATAAGQHVLTATTYSKSVLRVCCEQVAAARPDVAYFPSYEIITGSFSRGAYFAQDLRSVTEAGVSHVMRVFLGQFTSGAAAAAAAAAPDRHVQEMAELVAVNCDEEILDAG